MATLSSLSNRLRTELGDMGKSFVYSFVADGTTNRFLIPYSPLQGPTLVIHVNGTDVSSAVEVEEETGYLTFDSTPNSGAPVVVAGFYYRYFTDNEICHFVNDAFSQHILYHTDAYGRTVTMTNLPKVEEYPVAVYAATLALYTLATDASFDIDITAPDGVMIPRSERYRQLMLMVDSRKEQYRELCSQLGIGLYKIDVFSLRRISKTTNQYIPIFIPQEVDDISSPQRVLLPIPNYGASATPSSVPNYDLTMYQGDSFYVELDFPFDVTQYTWRSDIVTLPGYATALASFTIAPITGYTTKLALSLTSDQTTSLPQRCYWDIQATSITDPTYEQTYMQGMIFVTPQVTE